METIASEGNVLFPRRTESLLGIMLSVPGADRGPQPGSPLGVVDAIGLWAWQTRPSRELRPGRYRSRYRPHHSGQQVFYNTLLRLLSTAIHRFALRENL